MGILEDILTAGGSLVGGFILWRAARFVYFKFIKAVIDKVVKYLRNWVNLGGLFIYRGMKAKLKDEVLLKETLKDLDYVGDALDEAWDLGLQGVKIKE